MALRVHVSWKLALAQSPETGMGYQVVELDGTYQGPRYVIVLNGTLIHEPSTGPVVVREEFDRALTLLEKPREQARFRVLTRAQAVAARVLEARGIGVGPASEAVPEDSEADEEFLRFSAFAADVRIKADGSVTPGTYVTTYEDGMAHVKTGKDAVRRYALPTPEPAVHRYHLKPPSTIPVRRGTVQPAFGQPGGGVEVIFEGGAPAGTKQKQDQIPRE